MSDQSEVGQTIKTNPEQTQDSSYDLFILALTLLSIITVIALFLPLRPQAKEVVFFVDFLICIAFLFDFARSLVKAPNKCPEQQYYVSARCDLVVDCVGHYCWLWRQISGNKFGANRGHISHDRRHRFVQCLDQLSFDHLHRGQRRRAGDRAAANQTRVDRISAGITGA